MRASILAAFACAAGACSMLVPALRAMALRLGFVDHPGERKVHSQSVPYLGGVAVAIACVGAIFAVGAPAGRSLVMVLGATVLAVVGMLDDRFLLPVAPRLGAELLAAVAAVLAGVRIEITGFAPYDVLITIVWIVGITNAMNMVDNMDGLSCGLTAAAAAGIAVLSGLQGQRIVAISAAAIAGACLGFLMLNWHPARIFMGDSGALFVGFAIAVTSIQLRPGIGLPGSSVVPFLMLGVPLADVAVVTIERFRHGRLPYVGGKDHLSHRLHVLGLPVPAAVLILIGGQLVLSGLAVLVGRGAVNPGLALLGGAAMLGGLVGVAARAQVYDTPAVHGRAWVQGACTASLAIIGIAAVVPRMLGH